MDRRRIFVGLAAVLLVGGAFAAVAPRLDGVLPKPLAVAAGLPERVWTRFFPPRVAAASRLAGLNAAERAAVGRLAGRLDGRLVWSSNRSGNHELYLLDLRAGTVRQLTHHPNVDFFSRFSPDGRWIVFLRSQREWVSFREPTAWDVMRIRADGTGEERLARGGYHPTWTADGRGIVFQRGFQVIRLDLESRQETVLLDARREDPGVNDLGDPELASDGARLALYARPSLPGVAVLDLRTRQAVSLTAVQACQPTWLPDGTGLVWIEIEGRGGTRVMTGGADGHGRRVLIDLPGAHSHEYFPKVSNDGRWLVWGAAAEGHEHDRADYEIFVWPMGAPVEEAVRLTHHPGNDQWPDLFVPR